MPWRNKKPFSQGQLEDGAGQISPKHRHPPTRYVAPQPTIPKSESPPPRRPEYLQQLNRLGKPCTSVSNEPKR
jgi:hypothetical protein